VGPCGPCDECVGPIQARQLHIALIQITFGDAFPDASIWRLLHLRCIERYEIVMATIKRRVSAWRRDLDRNWIYNALVLELATPRAEAK